MPTCNDMIKFPAAWFSDGFLHFFFASLKASGCGRLLSVDQQVWHACTAKQKCQIISLSSASQTTYCPSVSISELELGCQLLSSWEDCMNTGHWTLKGWTQGQTQPPRASQPQGQCMAIIYALFILDTTNEAESYQKKSLRGQMVAATRESQRQFRVNNWKLAESDPLMGLCQKKKMSRLGCISAALAIAFGFL